MNTATETAAVAYVLPEMVRKEATTALVQAQRADDMKKGSRAKMTGVLAKAQPLEMHFFLRNAKGETLLDEYATVADLLDVQIFSEICGDKNKHKAFVLNTIAAKLSDVPADKVTQAQRECLEAAMPVAFNLLQRIDAKLERDMAKAQEACDEEAIAAIAAKKPEDMIEIVSKGIRVPFEAAINPPSDKAPESTKEEYAARVGGMVTFDGGTKERTFNALSRNVTPTKERAPSAPASTDGPFLAALKSMAKGNAERECLAVWFASLSTAEIFQIIGNAAANSDDRNDD
jgi:hypothetical protein